MLKRRLHGLLVQAAIEARGEEAESDVDDEGGAACAAAPPCGPARRVRRHGGLKVSRVFRVGDRRS